jgi:Flp pilus assembly protein TadG
MSSGRATGAPWSAFRRLREERGTTSIELALVLPVFLLMICGLMELSHYAYMRVALSDAAREGVRYAMVRGAASAAPATADSITTYVRSRIALLDPTDVTVTASFAPNNRPGSVVTVQVSYPYAPFLTGFYAILTAATVTDSAKMTIAQ